MESNKRKKIEIKNQKVPRHREKYPALNPKRAVKNRQEQLEVPYLDQLNDKEKEFMNRFLEETVITNFQHKGKKIYKTKKSKREFYSENNARNRCLYTKAKSMGTLLNGPTSNLTNILESKEQHSTPSEQEDYILAGMNLSNQDLREHVGLTKKEREALIKIGVKFATTKKS